MIISKELAFVTTEKGGVSIINLETYDVNQQLENKDKPRGVGILEMDDI